MTVPSSALRLTHRPAAAAWGAALVAGLVVVTGFTACGGGARPDDAPPGTDAGHRAEGGTRDASRPREAGIHDASFTDAAVDSGVLPPGGWTTVASVPCTLYASTTPHLAAPAFPWKACPSGRVGCELFFTEWDERKVAQFRSVRHAKAFEDSDGLHFSYTRMLVVPGIAPITVATVQRLHGVGEVVLAGSAGIPTCSPALIHGSAWGTAATVLDSPDGSVARGRAHVAYTKKGTSSMFESAQITTLLTGLNIVQGMVHGPGFVAAEVTSGGAIFPVGLDLSDHTVWAANVPPRPGGELAAAKNGYFAIIEGQIHFVPIGGASAPVVQPSPGHEIVFVAVDSSNQDALVWLETSQNRTENLLFSSPFATNEAALVRRLVARRPQPFSGIVNAGMIATKVSDSRVDIVRLSDGAGWSVDGETNVPFMEPVWVNGQYVWFGVSNVPFGAPGYPTFGGMVRIPRPTGAPTLANGL